MLRHFTRLAILAAALALPGSAQILCSTLHTIEGFGPNNCIIISLVNSIAINFTLGQYYTTPFTSSPLQYHQIAQFSKGSTYICGFPAPNIMPIINDYFDNITPDDITWTQTWYASILNAGYDPTGNIPGNWTVTYTDQYSVPGYNCCS